ncbi:hypothetical protein D3C76_1358550 [compost metagenome]
MAPVAAVERHAQHAQSIQAHTDRPLGKARPEIEDKGLCPLFGLALTQAAGLVAEIVVEVEVAQPEGGVAITQHVSLGKRRQGEGACADQVFVHLETLQTVSGRARSTGGRLRGKPRLTAVRGRCPV